MPPALKEQIMRDFESLSEEKQLQVMTFIQSLKIGIDSPKGISGKEAVRLFAGLLDEKSAEEMRAAIEAGCETIDEDSWKS